MARFLRRSFAAIHTLPARADTFHDAALKGTSPTRVGPLQFLAAMVIIVVSLLPMPAPILALGAVLVVALTPLASWISLIFFGIVMALSGILDYWPVQVGPINVYTIDFIAIIFLWTIAHTIIRTPSEHAVSPFANPHEKRLVALWALWCGLGVFFLLYGFVIQGYAFDRAFGDYRRQVWYAAAFLIPIFFPYSRKHLDALKYIIVLAGTVTIAIGIYRITIGTGARFDENNETGHLAVRWLWIVECMTLSTLLAYLVLVLRAGTGIARKVLAIALCFPAGILLLLSGWRLAMIYTVAAPLAALILWSWARRESLRRFVVGGFVAALAAVPAIAALPILLPDLFGRMLLDLRLRLVNDVVQGGFRRWAWTEGLTDFMESPIIGKGFGFYQVVALRNQSGFFNYVEMSNAHNVFVTTLYQTGILGFVPFVSFHGLFLVVVIRTIRRLPDRLLSTYIALFVAYGCYMGYANTQPFVSSQFIIMYLIMGFIIRISRIQGESSLEPEHS